MEKNRDGYISPLSTRYASREMQYLFSDNHKFRTWRRLWIALAKAERQLGLPITEEQLAQLEAHAEDVNYDVAEAREKLVRHDVMSHVYAYGRQCPEAEAIIHLGATSCYVGDNTDILILRDAARLVLRKCAQVLRNLSAFAEQHKALPCLAYTHLQPAQLTTVGKRAALWMNELVMDMDVRFRKKTWSVTRLSVKSLRLTKRETPRRAKEERDEGKNQQTAATYQRCGFYAVLRLNAHARIGDDRHQSSAWLDELF